MGRGHSGLQRYVVEQLHASRQKHSIQCGHRAIYYTRHCAPTSPSTTCYSFGISVFLWSNSHISTEAPTTTGLATTSNNNRCLTCANFQKSGTRSCCARGGAWFNKCGDVGDTKFDHTWAEGFQACTDFASSVSVESPLKAMFHDMGVTAYLINTTQSSYHLANDDRDSNISNGATAEADERCSLLLHVVIYLTLTHVQ